eukprot:2776388-Amphidinium_carterae.1
MAKPLCRQADGTKHETLPEKPTNVMRPRKEQHIEKKLLLRVTTLTDSRNTKRTDKTGQSSSMDKTGLCGFSSARYAARGTEDRDY